MKIESILCIAFLLGSHFIFSQTDYFTTIEKPDWDYASAIIEKTDGNLLIAGYSRSQTGTSYDILLVTIDSLNGQIIEEKFIEDSDDVKSAKSIKYTNDGGFIIGGSSSLNGIYNPYMLKLNAQEEKEWDIKLPDFNAALAGLFAFQHSNLDYYMVGKGLSGTDGTVTYFYRVSPGGNLLIADTLSNISGNQLIESHDGNLMLLGHIPTSDYDADIVLTKLNLVGDTIWRKQYVESEGYGVYGTSITTSNDGGYLLACYYEPEILDAYSSTLLIKVDSIGNIEWRKYLGPGIPSFVERTNSGYVLAVTRLQNFVFGPIEEKMTLRKLDENGEVTCAKYLDGYIQQNYGSNILETTNGSIFSVGDFNEPADIFVYKINSNCSTITNLEEISQDEKIGVFPNPVLDVLHLKNVPENSEVKIYDQFGIVRFEKTSNSQNESINIQNWNEGVYFLVVQNQEFNESFKLIKN